MLIYREILDGKTFIHFDYTKVIDDFIENWEKSVR